jgi:hypothetical protein
VALSATKKQVIVTTFINSLENLKIEYQLSAYCSLFTLYCSGQQHRGPLTLAGDAPAFCLDASGEGNDDMTWLVQK